MQSHVRLLVSLAVLWPVETAMADAPSRPDLPTPENARAAYDLKTCLKFVDGALSAEMPEQVAAKMRSANKYCARVAERDAAYDVSTLQTYMDAMNAWSTALSGEADAEAAAVAGCDTRAIATLMNPIRVNWTSDADTTRLENEAQARRALADTVAQACPPDSSALAALRDTYARERDGVAAELAQLDATLAGRVPSGVAWVTAIALEARWYAAARLFPGEPRFAETHATLSAWVGRFGTAAGVEAAASGARAAEAKKVHMAPAAVQDPQVEQQVRAAFDAQGWGETVLAIRLTDADWTVEADALGRITGRSRDAEIAARKPDGSCVLYRYTVVQPPSGSGWGTVRRRSHSSLAIACENVPR